jgi:hypothetical protein
VVVSLTGTPTAGFAAPTLLHGPHAASHVLSPLSNGALWRCSWTVAMPEPVPSFGCVKLMSNAFALLVTLA